jgi:hypothetical protein
MRNRICCEKSNSEYQNGRTTAPDQMQSETGIKTHQQKPKTQFKLKEIRDTDVDDRDKWRRFY